MITNEQILALKAPTREVKVRLEVLDLNENVIDEIQGISMGGSISVNAESTIRRQGNIDLLIEDRKYLPNNQYSKLWLNNRIRPYIYVNDVMVWKCGVFLLNNPNILYNSEKKSMSIPLYDKMSLFSGDVDGQLQAKKTKLDANLPIRDVVELIVKGIGLENKYSIMDCIDDTGSNLLLPYKFEKDGTELITSLLDEIRDLFMGFEYFYDEDGRFIWQKIKDRKYDIVTYEFDSDNDDTFTTSYQNNQDWQNVKNVIQVWGKAKDDGTQVQYLIENQSQGQFCIDKIGRRVFTHSDEKIFTQEQAKLNAEYQQFLHSHLNESITLECIPVFGLEANNIIYVNDKNTGIQGNYRIKDINAGLNFDSMMTITAQKLYYEQTA